MSRKSPGHRLSVRSRRGMTNKQWAEKTIGAAADRLIARMHSLGARFAAIEKRAGSAAVMP